MEQTNSDQRREGKGIMTERRGRDNQRTFMNDPWIRTTVQELTVGTGCGMGRGGQRGKNGTAVIE